MSITGQILCCIFGFGFLWAAIMVIVNLDWLKEFFQDLWKVVKVFLSPVFWIYRFCRWIYRNFSPEAKQAQIIQLPDTGDLFDDIPDIPDIPDITDDEEKLMLEYLNKSKNFA